MNFNINGIRGPNEFLDLPAKVFTRDSDGTTLCHPTAGHEQTTHLHTRLITTSIYLPDVQLQ